MHHLNKAEMDPTFPSRTEIRKELGQEELQNDLQVRLRTDQYSENIINNHQFEAPTSRHLKKLTNSINCDGLIS